MDRGRGQQEPESERPRDRAWSDWSSWDSSEDVGSEWQPHGQRGPVGGGTWGPRAPSDDWDSTEGTRWRSKYPDNGYYSNYYKEQYYEDAETQGHPQNWRSHWDHYETFFKDHPEGTESETEWPETQAWSRKSNWTGWHGSWPAPPKNWWVQQEEPETRNPRVGIAERVWSSIHQGQQHQQAWDGAQAESWDSRNRGRQQPASNDRMADTHVDPRTKWGPKPPPVPPPGYESNDNRRQAAAHRPFDCGDKWGGGAKCSPDASGPPARSSDPLPSGPATAESDPWANWWQQEAAEPSTMQAADSSELEGQAAQPPASSQWIQMSHCRWAKEQADSEAEAAKGAEGQAPRADEEGAGNASACS